MNTMKSKNHKNAKRCKSLRAMQRAIQRKSNIKFEQYFFVLVENQTKERGIILCVSFTNIFTKKVKNFDISNFTKDTPRKFTNHLKYYKI